MAVHHGTRTSFTESIKAAHSLVLSSLQEVQDTSGHVSNDREKYAARPRADGNTQCHFSCNNLF